MADKLKRFSCTYRFEGFPIGIAVEARSWEEVSARLRAIGMTALVVGEIPSKPDELRTFSCVYQFDGLSIDVIVDARSLEEIPARIRAIGTTGVVDGEQVREFEAGMFGEGLGRGLKAAQPLRERKR